MKDFSNILMNFNFLIVIFKMFQVCVVDPDDPDEFLQYTCEPLVAVQQVAMECRILNAAASSTTTPITVLQQEND